MSSNSEFKPFASGCGMCKPSTDYYKQPNINGGTKNKSKKNHKGGVGNYSVDGLIPQSNGKSFYEVKNYESPLDATFSKNNLGIDYATSFGGSKSKSTKSTKEKKQKGGMAPLFPEESTDLDTYFSVVSGGATKKTTKSTKTKSTKAKTSKPKTSKPIKTKSIKKMKGGMESSGATSLPSQFFNPEKPLDNYLELSGNGIMSAYGAIESGNIGTGMLAPYNSCSNHLHESTMMKTGGAKGKSKSTKPKSTKSKTSKPKTIKPIKTKSTKSIKKMKGGMESSGATSLPSQFFNPESPLDNYPELSGNGTMSAYGAIESGNIGTGMLAPYTASTCSSANQNTTMKTGGSKKNKKSLKGGRGGPIPSISDSPIKSVQNTVTNAISGFTGFMQQLDADYLKSVEYVKSIKIGNQRLIQGGSKQKAKKETKVKKDKKGTKGKKGKKQKGGSNGSDFALTLNSRGPANAPDDFWGVPGETWFKQFNKTGEYIPNSELQYAATPLLAGRNESNVVMGYNEADLAYPSV